MEKSIANPDPAKAIGRASECMRRLMEVGLTYEDLQKPINDPELRRSLVRFWKTSGGLDNPIIDCDADPSEVSGLTYTYKEQRRSGMLEWDLNRVGLYVSDQQCDGSSTCKGTDLYKEFRDKPVLNANVLDYLLAHALFIPDEWRTKFVCFWGTIYRGPDCGLYVRQLRWSKRRWTESYVWLGSLFTANEPAAMLIQD
jgi:hypothetical protein